MTGHVLIGVHQDIRDLWDDNPQCRCGHSWRSHWPKRAGGPCGVTHCGCPEWAASAAPSDGTEGPDA